MGPRQIVLLAILIVSQVGIIPEVASGAPRDFPDPVVPEGEANFSINWRTGNELFHPGASDVLVDDVLYMPCPLIAKNTEGDIVWRSQLTVDYFAYSDATLYCVRRETGRLSAVDATNGGELWNVTMNDIRPADRCKIAAGEGFIVLDTYHDFAGALHCLDASSGRTIWTYHCGIRFGGLAIQDGRVIASIFRGNHTNGTDVYAAFDLATGMLLWDHEVANDMGLSAPLVSGGSLYYISSEMNNSWISHLFCLNSTTGQLRWKTLLTYDRLEVQPLLHGGKLFAVDRHGDLFCVDAEQGKKLWSRSISAYSDSWPRDPAVGFTGDLIITGGDRVTVLNMTGSEIFRFRPGYWVGTPVFCNRTTAFFGQFDLVRGGTFAPDLFVGPGDIIAPDVRYYTGTEYTSWANGTVTIQVHNINFNRTNPSRIASAEVWLTDNGTRTAVLDESFQLSPDGLNTFKFSWNFYYGVPNTTGIPYTFEVILTPLDFTQGNITNDQSTITRNFRLEEYRYTPSPDSTTGYSPGPSLKVIGLCLTIGLFSMLGAVVVVWAVAYYFRRPRIKKDAPAVEKDGWTGMPPKYY